MKSDKIRYIAVAFFFMLSFLRAEAQQTAAIGNNEVSVSDAWVSREKYTLVIEYQIELGENITSCDVHLLISQDGGRNFSPVSAKEGLTGDVGKVTSSGQKMIIYDINSVKNELAGKELAFKVEVKDKKEKKEKKENKEKVVKNTEDTKGKFFIMGTGSTFGTYGVKAGYVNKVGGYASYSDAFTGGMLDNWTVNAGLVIRATRWLYPYVGVGYGQMNFYNDDDDDDDDYRVRYNMLPFEAGAMCRFGPVVLSAAVEPIYVLNKDFGCAFELGIGFCF